MNNTEIELCISVVKNEPTEFFFYHHIPGIDMLIQPVPRNTWVQMYKGLCDDLGFQPDVDVHETMGGSCKTVQFTWDDAGFDSALRNHVVSQTPASVFSTVLARMHEFRAAAANANHEEQSRRGSRRMKGTRCQNIEEELAVLQVRLKRLNTKQLQVLLIFVQQWREAAKE